MNFFGTGDFVFCRQLLAWNAQSLRSATSLSRDTLCIMVSVPSSVRNCRPSPGGVQPWLANQRFSLSWDSLETEMPAQQQLLQLHPGPKEGGEGEASKRPLRPEAPCLVMRQFSRGRCSFAGSPEAGQAPAQTLQTYHERPNIRSSKHHGWLFAAPISVHTSAASKVTLRQVSRLLRPGQHWT